jgi:diguanylate cyclase (GGDEF)-like protein
VTLLRKVDNEASGKLGSRFIVAVLVPVLVLALGLTIFAYTALRSAAEQADRVSAARQAHEVRLTINDALDELAQSQAGIAIWNPAVLEARKAHPNRVWLDSNVGTWLNYVFAHDADFILNDDDNPIYAMVGGNGADPAAFQRVAKTAKKLVDAARGRLRRNANPHERLPAQPLTSASTVRTSVRAIHATDLVRIHGRPAAMSVMRMIPDSPEIGETPGHEPLLVSLRYLDGSFMRSLARVQLIRGAKFQRVPVVADNEHALALISSGGEQIGHIVWRPDRPGDSVWNAMAPSAGLALLALLAALAALIFSIGKLMRKDAQSLELLNAAHLELKAKEAQAHHLAFHDPLTGLPNRAYFALMADQRSSRECEAGLWAILLVDLDRFKQVNDSLGHLGGDQLIQHVGARLEGLLSPADVLARIGGDEFAILLGDRTDAQAIGLVAAAMVTALREPFEILGTSVFIGASIGVSWSSGQEGDRSEMMRMADIAMYRAKGEGRDGYRFFSEEMDESVRLRRAIERDLRDALVEKRDLFVHYQPQVGASGQGIVGVEALLRWRHPERGWLSPTDFVPIAEETGLIRELGLFVLRDACAVAQAWPSLSVAVNLSPVQFRGRGFAAEICEVIAEAGARPEQIELEVTESILLDNDDLVRSALIRLRQAGFRIALDDFGTGYSSLSYLKKFEVDKIKIDKSFTSRLGEADGAPAIIQAVVRLGHAMGLLVSAEGVETIEQRAFLELAGCNELQGFLFSEAVPPSKLEELMKRSRHAA